MATPAFTLESFGPAPVSAGGKPEAARQASPELRMEFEKIVQQGLPQFRRAAMRWLRNPEDAEDAVQDAMLSAFKHIAAFDGRARLSTWVMAIVINAVRMQMRRRPRGHFVSLDQAPEEGQYAVSEVIADPKPTPEQTVVDSQLRDLAARLTSGLPDSQRAALRLRQRDGLSLRQTAEALGVPEGTLKSQLARGQVFTAFGCHCHETTNRTETQFPPKHDYPVTTSNCEFLNLRSQGTRLRDQSEAGARESI